MTVGLVGALLTILIVANALPVLVGVNHTLIVHVAFTAILEPHVLVEPKVPALIPVTVTVLIVKGAVPEFVTVIICTELFVFSA